MASWFYTFFTQQGCNAVPSQETQQHVSIVVVHFEGKNFFHSVDECTTWWEVGYISRKSINLKIFFVQQIQMLRHGCPRSIKCDREYDSNLFKPFCRESDITLLLGAANDYEANGLVENWNRTLTSFFDRLRPCEMQVPTELLKAEATSSKNTSLGSRRASAFELLYNRWPSLIDAFDRSFFL